MLNPPADLWTKLLKRPPFKIQWKTPQAVPGRAPASYLNFSTISSIEESKLSELANLAFLELATRHGIDTNPADFATLAVKGMKTLKNHNKGNLIYKFAMCIAKTRQSLFPLDRMQFGLVEFQIEFFSATNIMGVGLLSDEFTTV